MIIYVVKSGDSLYTISEKFGMTTGKITAVNGLGTHPYLVAGQALLIPSHITEQGNDHIILLPKETYHAPISVYAEAVLSTFSAENLVREAGGCLTGLAPIGFEVKADCNLVPVGDEEVISKIREENIVFLHIMCKDTSVLSDVLTDEDKQWALIQNILKFIMERGLRGLKIDSSITCFAPPVVVRFARNIMKVLQPLKIPVIAELEPVFWHGTYSLATIGNVVDMIIIKAYDLKHHPTPNALAPLDFSEEIISDAASMIPTHKLLLGLPVYGGCWQIPDGKHAAIISINAALAAAARNNAVVKFDNTLQSAYLNIPDQQTIWFEDIRSIYSKLQLIPKYKLRGVSLDLYEYDAPAMWKLLSGMFDIEKM